MASTSAPGFVLASSSSIRLHILQGAGLAPEVIASGVDETFADDMPTVEAVVELALRKARVVAEELSDALVLGCDSMLDFGGEALGKPPTSQAAIELWRRFSGKEATLYTGHCLIDTRSQDEICEVASTLIRFGCPTEREIASYVATGEPMQMAGGFGIDGRGGPFVEGIDGDHSNVLGLSLPLLRRMLAELGLSICDFWAVDSTTDQRR